jgi:hypothetical protein
VRSTRRQRRWHWREAERKQVTRQAAGPLRHTARLSWATKPWFSSRFLRGRGCGRWNTKQIAGTLVGNSIPRQWLFRILFGRRPRLPYSPGEGRRPETWPDACSCIRPGMERRPSEMLVLRRPGSSSLQCRTQREALLWKCARETGLRLLALGSHRL